MLIKNSVFVVTGGASNDFGRATVKVLLEEGANVVICDLPTKFLHIYGDDKAIFLPVNITSEKDVQTLLTVVQEKYKRLDGIVNCVDFYEKLGVYDLKLKEPHSLEKFTEIINENILGIFNLLRLTLPLLVENKPKVRSGRGIIINMTNNSSFDGDKETCAYSASKAAIQGLTEALSEELEGHRIRCVCISTSLASHNKLSKEPNDYFHWNQKESIVMDEPRKFGQLVKADIESTVIRATNITIDNLKNS
ncbi:3-hydroxyacyl-CoA dehydrogenase type-2-like [Sitophilus oryzae]|uniref:3-hydroxyacyl-CoA dehydrogenase type-2-like n=1 Tax=Sitophilus oryzae TaxID=7048 RepID=A0A6J2YAD9_SITOR|nr:3-hydroxyacyl-CoA dehydrogenase type-2-like [Sitophilus oryzae]